MSDRLLNCNPAGLCVVGHYLLPESKKEQVKEPLEPTQQELVVKASQEAGFSKTLVVVDQFFRTSLVCVAHGRSVALYWEDFTRPRCSIHDNKKYPWTNPNRSRSGRVLLVHILSLSEGLALWEGSP